MKSRIGAPILFAFSLFLSATALAQIGPTPVDQAAIASARSPTPAPSSPDDAFPAVRQECFEACIEPCEESCNRLPPQDQGACLDECHPACMCECGARPLC